MGYRDDHKAAIARGEALQRELDLSKQQLAASEKENEQLRVALARTRGRINMSRSRH